VNPHLLIVVLVATGESFVSISSFHAIVVVLLIKGIVLPSCVDFSCCVDFLLCEIEYRERLG
jgi:hypothetical protein